MTFLMLFVLTMPFPSGTLSASSTQRVMITDGNKTDVAVVLPIAMVFGVSIMVLAYSIGHMTGGHMNPGVSCLMFFRRQMSFIKMISYWIAQFVGGILGASITWGCISGLQGDAMLDSVYPKPPFNLGSTTLFDGITTGNGFLLEFMGSFFFYFVIAQTALDKRGIGSSMFPAIPIGFSLVVVHILLIRKSEVLVPETYLRLCLICYDNA
jgi:aquaporin Z